jgi:hypothetical protein
MKQYVIDELRPEDYLKIKAYLDANCKPAGISGVYWLQVPDELLSDDQKNHEGCRPFYLALELDEESLSCGLLVRSARTIRCLCVAYANNEQRNWLVETVDAMVESVGVIV